MPVARVFTANGRLGHFPEAADVPERSWRGVLSESCKVEEYVRDAEDCE